MSTPEQRITPPAAPEGVTVHGRDEFTEEFVTQRNYSSPFNTIHTLSPTPWNIHETTRWITPEELARMSRDPKIHKSARIIIHGTLTDDFQFAPGATETESGSGPNYNKFVDMQQFCERMIAGLDKTYWVSMEMLLKGALEQGHKIAETVWEYRVDRPLKKPTTSGPSKGTAQTKTASSSWWPAFFSRRSRTTAQDGTADDTGLEQNNRFARRATVRLMPRAIKVKPFGRALFVVDDFGNELGIVPSELGQQSWGAHEVISRDKFIVLTLNPEDNDPRGNSTWRPAYNYYHLAGHIPKNYLKLLLQEGMPIPVLTLPPNTAGWLTVKDERGQIVYETVQGLRRPKMMSVAEAAEKTLEKMYLGKGVAIPDGAKLEPYRKTGSNVGEVFAQALKVIYNIIEESILLQPLAQSAGDVQSKSAAAIHADVLGDAFFWYKRAIAVMTLYDFCAVGVRANFGEQMLVYMPKLSLGDSEKRDWARDLEVLAKAFWYGFVDETQRAELMAWLGMPKPGPPPTQPKSGQAQADANGNPAPPANQRPDNSGRGRQQPDQQPAQGQSTDAKLRAQFEEITHNVRSYESSVLSVGHHTARRRATVEYLPARAYSQSSRASVNG